MCDNENIIDSLVEQRVKVLSNAGAYLLRYLRYVLANVNDVLVNVL